MADPFDVLAQGAPAPHSGAGQQQQSSSSPRPGWPGVNHHAAATSSASSFSTGPPPTATITQLQQHRQPPYAGLHYQQQQQQQQQQNFQMGHGHQHHAYSLGGSAATYPAGQQSQQQQRQQQDMMMPMDAAPTAAPWGSGGGGFNAASGLFHPAASGQNPNLPAGGVATSALPHDQATGGRKSTTAVPGPSPAPQVSAGSGGGGGGAEWMPPPEQVPEYDALFRSASAGCAVPGTVSGRIAVQFFSRSGLSKDVLKTIWSLCDPSLTGSIRRPGFFAAMRLIALAQQGSLSSQGMAPLPSISALEATRHARLPLPRMGGFPSGFGVGADGVVGGGGNEKLPSVSSAAAPAVSSPSAVAATASPSSVFSNTFQAPPPTAVGPGSEVSMGNNNAVCGTAADEPRTESGQQRPLPAHEAVASAPATPASEDDDFGEFAGCLEEPQQHPTPPTDQSQDDDFGEFSGAPGDAPATAVASPASLATERAASPVATNALRTAEPSASGAAAAGGDAWMMGGGGGGGGGSVWSTVDSGKGAGGGIGGGNLDDLIKTNVQEAGAGPVHLSDMQMTTPPLAEKAHNPVMVDRASSSRTKLSVFDEMADLDLAVGQEDWNDFADETTAPPRSPTPSPPPPPTIAEEVVKAAGVMEPAIDDAISHSDADIRGEPRPLDQDPGVGSRAGGSSSPAALAEDEQKQQQRQQQQQQQQQQGMPPVSPEGAIATSAHASITDVTAPAAAAAAAQGQDDEWGDFEDAMAGGEGKTGQQHLPGPEGEATAVREDNVATNDATAAANDDDDDDDDEEEEWGTFADAPVAAAEEEAGLAIGDASSTSGSPEAPPEEAVDPFADIAPATPPPPPPRPPTVGATAEEEEAGRLGSEEGDGSGSSPSEAAATTTVMAPGLPLSLRGLRDALAKRGRLEEAVEVQRRMELPSSPPRTIDVPYSPEDVTADDANADADGGGEAEDADLERWRAAAAEDLRPFRTMEELAATMSAADAARGEKFRERFVRGRPPVEEEALAGGGGAAALGVAVKRQRSARRAVCLLSMLDAVGTAGDGAADQDLEYGRDGGLTSGGEKEEGDELELDVGLDTRRARSPPSLADWAAMMSYVTSMAGRGIEALAGGGAGSRSGSDRAAATPASPTRPSSPFSRPTTEREGADDGAEIDSAGVPPDADALASDEGAVRREVARSQEFESFCRGLREAVKVCRMLQASAEDGCCLQGVDGFAAMERAWAELRRSAREAAAAGDDGGGGDLPSVFGVEDGEEGGCMGKEAQGVGGSPGAAAGLVEGKGERTAVGGGVAPAGSTIVAVIREACVETAPPAEDSALCGVSLQPLAVFSGGAGGGGSGVEPPGVVEYCGVRYFACAINLWVNVLDKPPPGPSPDKNRVS
ncbi:unnamed protein product [Ectocarpus sp. 4 AP-2014]